MRTTEEVGNEKRPFHLHFPGRYRWLQNVGAEEEVLAQAKDVPDGMRKIKRNVLNSNSNSNSGAVLKTRAAEAAV